MPTPSNQPPHLENNTNDLSTYLSEMLPGSGDDCAAFLASVALALGLREAELARELGVTHGTFSNWKKRGKIPVDKLHFFRSRDFANWIVFRQKPNALHGRHAGIPCALEVFRQSEFNPFNVPAEYAVRFCAQYFSGICVLCLYLSQTCKDAITPEWDQLIARKAIRILELLGEGMAR